eukprot:scaffold468_cov216-Pinguiococcus_pyrenoidosus.AAC.3
MSAASGSSGSVVEACALDGPGPSAIAVLGGPPCGSPPMPVGGAEGGPDDASGSSWPGKTHLPVASS